MGKGGAIWTESLKLFFIKIQETTPFFFLCKMGSNMNWIYNNSTVDRIKKWFVHIILNTFYFQYILFMLRLINLLKNSFNI